jgi:glycosyltransferase involved in cell wall biosynthesis
MPESHPNKGNTENIIYIQDLFASFSRLNEAGFLKRIIDMFDQYSDSFDYIYILTSDQKKLDYFPPNTKHIPFPHSMPSKYRRLFYFFFSSFSFQRNVKYVELSGTTAIISTIFYKLLGKRIFLYHGWDLSKTLEAHNKQVLAHIAKFINILAFKISDTIAVSTRTIGNDVRKYTSIEKIYLLPNYVDINHFKPCTNLKKKKNLLIYVGRLHKDKNLFMLMDVMKELPQFDLWILGDGPLKERLLEYKKINSIINVKFLGTIQFEVLPNFLNKASAFILVSHIEGLPVALLEGMACGLPCIGTNVSGINDVIVDGFNGVLCCKNKDNIKNAIIYLFNSSEKMAIMSKNCRDHVIKNFSEKVILERKIKLIKGQFEGINPLFQNDSK